MKKAASGNAAECTARVSHLRARVVSPRPSERQRRAQDYLRLAQRYAELAEATLDADREEDEAGNKVCRAA